MLVGVFSVSPQLLAIRAIGPDYKGIHLFSSDDNTYYVARMRDIVDGHGWISSPFIYEYKNQTPLLPPISEYLYMLPGTVFFLPLVTTLILDKFLFPVLLFLLVYLLIFELTLRPKTLDGKINAIAGGLFVTLGYNLIDYSNVWRVFTGALPGFILWTRPINPIIGAILIFIFLYNILQVVQNRSRHFVWLAGFVFSLMIGYVFAWSLMLAIIGVMILIFLFQKQFRISMYLGYTLAIGFLLSTPYWYALFLKMNRVDGQNISQKNGLIFTHQPLLNKALLMMLAIFLICLLWEYWQKHRLRESISQWWLICLAFIVGGLVVLNQQIITGRTIWPYHFVQYTIPLSMVAMFALSYNFIKQKASIIWGAIVVFAVVFSLAYGVAVAKNFQYFVPQLKIMQRYAGVLQWLDRNAQLDCVVLVSEGADERLTRLIPGFTSCNVYTAHWIFAAQPDDERVLHNFLSLLRINGVSADAVEDYLTAHDDIVREYFYRDWNDLLVRIDDRWQKDLIKDLTGLYRDFATKNFIQELKKYRIDYFAFDNMPDSETLRSLGSPKQIGEFNGIYLYQL